MFKREKRRGPKKSHARWGNCTYDLKRKRATQREEKGKIDAGIIGDVGRAQALGSGS